MKKPRSLFFCILLPVACAFALGQPHADPIALPGGAQLVVGVGGEAPDQSGPAAKIRRLLLKEFGLDDSDGRFRILVDPGPEEIASLTFVGLLADDESKPDIVGIARGEFGDSTERSLRLSGELTSQRDFQVLTDSKGEAFFGDADAVKKVLQAHKDGSGSKGPISEGISEVEEGAEAWAVYTGGWLKRESEGPAGGPEGLGTWSLQEARSGMEWASFSAWQADDGLRLKLVALLGTTDAARLLEDELRTYLESAQRMRGSDDLKKALQEARVERDASRLFLIMALGAEAAEQLAEGGRSGVVFRLNLRDDDREDWQRISDIYRHLDLKPGSRVADIGAGRGFLSFRLARAVGDKGRVWAVDIDKDSLKTLRERAERSGYSQVEVVEGKPDSPGLPRDSLDGVVIVNAYHEMVKYRKMLKQIRRSLVSGGRLVLIEPFDPERRDDPRQDQVRRHDIAPELVEQEIRQAGFELLTRDDDFILRPMRESLVVARKP